MTPFDSNPHISVIVPVLNEAQLLPELFRTLAGQKDVTLEVAISDGGSTDGTPELARRLAEEHRLSVTVVSGGQGRGRQMNAGAAVSRGPTLLFLHADSTFTDSFALRKGLDALDAAVAAQGSEGVAGHFALRFNRSTGTPSLGYYYYECKARLDLRECTHGDQGFLMRRGFFQCVGPFDESLPMVAETRLAEAIRLRGKWLLLPAEINTSARRLETEGLWERQTLNAILMNFAAMGWEPFFREIPRLYQVQDRTRRLQLFPLLLEISRLIHALPLRERFSLWHTTGAYVRRNAWQLAFFFDVRRNFRRGLPPGEGNTPILAFYDRYLDLLTDHPPGRLAAACLTWLWFRVTRLYTVVKGKGY
ncbi:MAG: glycosyl transferase family [Geobacteraceae bacterium]|nr:MAG: glycosyl transferase family [Geobacteraceae bacterium]